MWFEGEYLIPTDIRIQETRYKFSRLLNGNQEITYLNGDHYVGDWFGCRKNGYGVYTWKDGSRYSGYWRDDEQFGFGEYSTQRLRDG